MPSTFNLSDFSVEQEAIALNQNTVFASATLTIYDGVQPANANTNLAGNNALAIFTLPASGLNTVSPTGLITFGPIANVSAIFTGAATFARVTNGANTICDMSVGVGGGADCIINSANIQSGATVSIASMTYQVTE